MAPLFATVVAIPVGVATCFLLSRAGTAAFASVLSSRRFRDFAFVGLALLGMAFGVGANLIAGLVDGDLAGLRVVLADAATVAGWTPFGWAWAVPAEVAQGRWLAALLRLVLAVAFVALLWWGWQHYLDRRLTEPLEASRGAGRVRSGGWADRIYPATPAGGVAARTLHYWRRDPRYVAGIAGFLIGPVILMVAQLANPYGQLLVAAFAPTLLCWLIGSSMAQDLSYDGSALWMHAASGLRGVDDRIGRVLSTLTVFVPVLLLLTVVGLALTGRWDVWLPVLAVSVTLTLVSLGVGSFVGDALAVAGAATGSQPLPEGQQRRTAVAGGFRRDQPGQSGADAADHRPGDRVLLDRLAGLARAGRRSADRATRAVAGCGPGRQALDQRWPEVLAAVSEP